MAEKKNLFFFTKNFPYGTSEQYIVGEIESLIETFDKVIFVPSEYFGDPALKIRTLPAACEVLHINQLAAPKKIKRNWVEFMYVFLFELAHSRKKSWVIKNRKRFSSVLLHQMQCASVLEQILEKEYTGTKNYFYAYWIHNSSILLGLLKRRKVIAGFVSRGHAIDLYEWDWAPGVYVDPLPYYNFIIHQARRIFSISEDGYNYLKSRFPRFSSKFSISRLGVKDIGINPDSAKGIFTIVSCSGIDKRKRIETIAEVISKMKTPVRWIHFGDGPSRQNLEMKIKELPEHVQVELKGFVKNDEIMKFYSAVHVDLLINLSTAEGIPVSMMEAISFGIPVFATDVYGNREVANEKTGFCVPLNTSTTDIATILDSFASDESQQALLRKSARKYFQDFFNSDKNFRSFVEEIIQTF